MFLKNYTSTVPVSVTIAKIETVLIRCGVSGIMKEYVGTNGEIAALTFKIATATNPVTIRMPANKTTALEALWSDYVNGDKVTPDGQSILYNSYKKKRKKDFEQQSERTAWKIVQDWIEVQMSMIQLRQADTLQVFLPYIYDGQRSYYEALREQGFRGLLEDKKP